MILMVPVGIDDYIGSKLDRPPQPADKRHRQPPVHTQRKDMMNPRLSGHLDSFIRAAVVDNQILDLVNAIQLTRQILYHFLKGIFLVIARYLNNQFHK